MKGDRVVTSRRIPVSLHSDPTVWAKGVRSSAEALEAVVRELNLAGTWARVVYRSPTQAVDLASFDLRSGNQARGAAILPCLESLSYAASSAVAEAVVMGRDRGGDKRRWHIMVAADRIDVTRAIVEMVESTGLRFESATPIDAAVLAGLIRRALNYAGPTHGWLHFGKHSSFFVLGGEGRVRFQRSIGLGVETIVQSLTRPIRMPDENPIELDYETAKTIVHEHGIPENDEVLDSDRQLTRRHIMPQIQPVLQRYVVEVRQSLRFGLPESERDSIAITVTGPGSTIPGLTQLIAWELKLQFKPDPDYPDFDYQQPAGPGSELLQSMQDRRFLNCVNLQPTETANRRQVGQLRKWLWAGAAAAVAVVGFDALRLQSRVTELRGHEATLTSRMTELETLDKTHKKLLAALGALAELELTVATEVGARANLRAILQELSILTPKSVRLNSVRLSRENDFMVARIYGRASQVNAAGQTELEPFIEALKASPIFLNAELKNVEVTSGQGGMAGQRFEATFAALLAPDPDEMADGSGGTTP